MPKETAHQLGTPISALMGWVQRIKKYPDKSMSIMNEMEIDINRLTEISDRFSKIGSSVKLTEVNLSQVVRENIKYLKKRYSFDDDSLELSVEEKASPVIVGDYTIIGWAIENMIKNSIDSIEIDKRIIKVIIDENRKSGIIYIKDNGKGIEKQNWNKIFKPGFTTKLRGWGIGLSLVKRIIEELHHGKIFVLRSQNNKGTTFKIILNK
jgi:Signal transduction histidine kinase